MVHTAWPQALQHGAVSWQSAQPLNIKQESEISGAPVWEKQHGHCQAAAAFSDIFRSEMEGLLPWRQAQASLFFTLSSGRANAALGR